MDILSYAIGSVTNFITGTTSLGMAVGDATGLGIIGALAILIFFLYLMKNNITSWWMLAIIAILIMAGAGLHG